MFFVCLEEMGRDQRIGTNCHPFHDFMEKESAANVEVLWKEPFHPVKALWKKPDMVGWQIPKKWRFIAREVIQ
jgi:hypothetical protein